MGNEKNFLGLEFTELTLAHQDIIEGFFQKYPQRLSEYNFATLIAWRGVFRYLWTRLDDDTLLVAAYLEALDQYHLIQPVGAFSKVSQQVLLNGISKNEYPVKLFAVSGEFIAANPDFCSYFEDQEERNYGNYLYRSVDLSLLAGRRYESKRNLISQIDKVYQWTLEPLKASCQDCPKILADLGAKEPGEMTRSLENELKALDTILTHYDKLHLKGYTIVIHGKPVAFSVVNVLNPTTKVVLFEKADRHFKGLFQLINRETSKAILEDGYEFINREEDLGLEGLRKSKLSYYPIEIVPSHILTFQPTDN